MLVKKLRVGVIYGGRSGEHEVSLASAAAVFKNLDPERYEAVPIRIEKDGRWTLPDRAARRSISAADVIHGAAGEHGVGRTSTREAHLVAHPGSDTLMTIDREQAHSPIVSGLALDVVFPVLHGPYGEDGTVQGLLELANVPVRRRRRARLRGRHGQGDDEAGVRGEGPADLRLRGRAEARLAARRTGGDATRRQPARVPGVRQAGEPRIERRHLEGEARDGAAHGDQPRRRVRPQDRHRGRGAARARDRVSPSSATTSPRPRCRARSSRRREFYDYEAKYLDDSSRDRHPRRSCRRHRPRRSGRSRSPRSRRSTAPAWRASISCSRATAGCCTSTK